MSARPTAREGIKELSIDDHVVLYDPVTRRAHLLNASAAAIWSCCNGDEDLDQIAHQLAKRFDAPLAAVRADVQSTVDRFVEVDLLGPANSRTSGSGWSATAVAGDRVADDYPRAERQLGPFAAFAHRFVVATVDADLVEPITVGLAGLIDESRDGAGELHRYDISVAGDHHVVLFDERLVRVAASGAEAVSFLYWHVHRQAIEQATDLVRLHAAAVRVGDLVVALPAPPESGKSTLVTALVAAGFGYVTDEVVAFSPDTGEVVDLPLPITLDRGSWPLFPDLVDQSVDTQAGPGSQSVPASRVHRGALGESHRGGHIGLCVFHRYQPGVSTSIRRLAPPDALVQLLENSFGLDEADDATFDALVAMARDLPCLRLDHSSLSDAVAAVSNAAREVESGTLH